MNFAGKDPISVATFSIRAQDKRPPYPASHITPAALYGYLKEVDADMPAEVRSRGMNRNWYTYHFLLNRISTLAQAHGSMSDYLDLGAGAGVIPLVLGRAGVQTTVMDYWDEYFDSENNLMGTFSQFVARFESNGVRWVRHNLLDLP